MNGLILATELLVLFSTPQEPTCRTASSRVEEVVSKQIRELKGTNCASSGCTTIFMTSTAMSETIF